MLARPIEGGASVMGDAGDETTWNALSLTRLNDLDDLWGNEPHNSS
jgi:hypothetical protein